MTTDHEHPKPKRKAPAALLAAQVRFKPGHAGLAKCTAIARGTGKRCGHIAAHGLATCRFHHAGTRARLLKSGLARCEAWTWKRPAHQCANAAKPGTGGLCTMHARLAAQGHTDARGRGFMRTPAGQRVKRVPKRVPHNAHPPKPKHMSPVLAHAAPRELRALPVWRVCTGQRERAALVQAYMQRDVHPDTWRKAVRDVHERARERDT